MVKENSSNSNEGRRYRQRRETKIEGERRRGEVR